jgi:hypothetical protein
MPHRDPVVAILARCDQLERRIAAGGRELPIAVRQVVERASQNRALRHALDAQHALEQVLRELGAAEEEERLSEAPEAWIGAGTGRVFGYETSRRRWRAAIRGLAALAVVASLLYLRAAPTPGSRPPSELRTEFVAVVVSTRGQILAGPHDRCVVSIDGAPGEAGGACSVSIICPGLERHLDRVPCTLPRGDAPFALRDPSLMIDGAAWTLALVERDGATERGRAELQIDWR